MFYSSKKSTFLSFRLEVVCLPKKNIAFANVLL